MDTRSFPMSKPSLLSTFFLGLDDDECSLASSTASSVSFLSPPPAPSPAPPSSSPRMSRFSSALPKYPRAPRLRFWWHAALAAASMAKKRTDSAVTSLSSSLPMPW